MTNWTNCEVTCLQFPWHKSLPKSDKLLVCIFPGTSSEWKGHFSVDLRLSYALVSWSSLPPLYAAVYNVVNIYKCMWTYICGGSYALDLGSCYGQNSVWLSEQEANGVVAMMDLLLKDLESQACFLLLICRQADKHTHMEARSEPRRHISCQSPTSLYGFWGRDSSWGLVHSGIF